MQERNAEQVMIRCERLAEVKERGNEAPEVKNSVEASIQSKIRETKIKLN